MANKIQLIQDLLLESSLNVTHSVDDWLNFLNTSAFMYRYSFNDQLLIYAQKPNARACAEFDIWNERLHRWINRGSKGIALINDTGKTTKLRYVFDILDTHGPRDLKIWAVNETNEASLLESMQSIFNIDEDVNQLQESILKISENLVEDNFSDYASTLTRYHDDSGLEGLSNEEITRDFKILLKNSVAYSIMKRCELDTHYYLDPDDFYAITSFDTVETVGLLGSATRDINEMALNEISKVVIQFEKENRRFENKNQIVENKNEEKQRSDLDGQQNRIQSSGRLPNPQPNIRTTDTSRKIRDVTQNVSQEQSSGTILLPTSEKRIEPTLDGSSATSSDDVGENNERYDDVSNNTKQDDSAIRMGTSNEQHQTLSGGNRSTGSNLQLDLNIDGGNFDNQVPPFLLSDVETILRSEDSLKHSKVEIMEYFHEHLDEHDRANYLRECYDETYVEIFRNPQNYDFSHIGRKKENNGLIMWSGTYLNPSRKSFYDFYYLQGLINELIEKDIYLMSPAQQMTHIEWAADNGTFNSNVEKVFFNYHDFMLESSSSIIEYFNTHDLDEQISYTQSIYPDGYTDFTYEDVSMGFEKTDTGLNIYFGSHDHRSGQQHRSWQNVTSDIAGLIISRLYDPSIQLPNEEDQRNAVYSSIENFNNGQYFSNEEITRTITQGSLIRDGKLRIYDEFQKNKSMNEYANFLKDEYGLGGSSSAFPGAYISMDSSSKGLTLSKNKWIGEDTFEYTLKWTDVAKRVKQLIDEDRYLSPNEKQEYKHYLVEKMRNELEYERQQIEDDYKLPVDTNIIEIDNRPKQYVYASGDTFYKGIDEYEIIEVNDNVEVRDKDFPLFSESYTKDEFENLLKDNPLNERLLQVIDTPIKSRQDVYSESLPILVDRIRHSSIYPSLRDRDTTVDEAYDLIRSELLPIISSMNIDHHELYVLYNEDDEFKELIINDIIDRTYEDYSNGIDHSKNLSNDDYSILYEQFENIAGNIANHKSCYMHFVGNKHDIPLIISNHDDEPNKVTMIHYVQNNGMEMNDPLMEFEIDRENKTLKPIYYKHDYPYLELSLDDDSLLSNEEIQNELDNYAKSWLSNILNKNYQLESEQTYKDDSHIGFYSIDINSNEIVYTDMPYSLLQDYAQENNLSISHSIVVEDEISTAQKVLSNLKMDDVYVAYDEENQELMVHDDMDNVWHGQEFYDFMLNEAIVYEQDGSSNVINNETLEHFKSFSKEVKPIIQEKIPTQKINYHINDDDLGAGTPKVRYQNNIAAIKLLFLLEKENRYATSDEQDILSKYVGWGGLSEAFDETNSSWSNEYHELKNLLNEEEYRSARESTLSAFYTSPIVIESIYQVLSNTGFKYGNILEPSCGIGNFLGMLPESMSNSKMYGIELDSLSGRIAKQLYQNSSIMIDGFENVNIPDSFFDVAIGNVPFGQFKVLDKKYDKYNFSIHDYFFAKTIDKVRPNGIIAFITSRYTLDKANSSVRKYIHERADFLGAIRLPNNAFKEAAGTKTISDIIFLQKRERPLISNENASWLSTEKNNDGLVYNSYFIDNPEMVLGNVKASKGMYGRDDLTVEPFEVVTLKEALESAIVNIHAQIDEREFDESIEEESSSIPADPNVRNFSYTIVDGEIYYRENSVMNKVDVSQTARSRIMGLVEIRDTVRELITLQTNDNPDADIVRQQTKLNAVYDEFTSNYGLINSRANISVFRDDSSYYLLSSLEDLNDDGTLKRKADMFTKRTIKIKSEITHVDNANEALMISLKEKAKVDIDYIAQLTDKTNDEIIEELEDIIYEVPNVLEPDAQKTYVTADEYLSGNIREKLEIAKMSSEIDPTYQHHVGVLEKAMPTPLTASEIEVRIGATWVPVEIYKQFMFELLSTGNFNKSYIDLTYVAVTDNWNIKNKGYDRGNIKANKTYGTSRANAYRLIEDCLNLKSTKIYDYEYNDEGKKVAILNKKETMIAQQKQDSIKEVFNEWIWKDPERRSLLTDLYNERFNSIRPREYNGDHLEFDRMTPEITLRKHQKDAVAHMLYGNNVLLAHVVGAGKTFEMIAASMEMKRLGLSQKPMFVVPNHLVEQWGSEFLQLYPTANILVTTKRDFEKSRRKRFCSRIATGEYDAIIIGHSQFEKIPMSVERQQMLIQQQIDAITLGIQDLKTNNGERFTIKQLEKTRKSLETRLKKLNDESRKDDLITFEELGVDRLFVDEAHFYKNLFLYSKMKNVSGLAQSEAQKSSDLFMKCQYLDEITGGKGIVFATGTPISNSMTEMYTMQRYLQYNTLQKNGLVNFDSWASTFGETIHSMELAPEGTTYRMKTRFARFYNLPELINMFKEVADIKTADMLNLPVPQANFHNVSVPPSDIQKDLVKGLGERAEAIRGGGIDPSEDNMLKITNDGRKLALDQRLIDSMLPEYNESKVNACINNVLDIYQNNMETKATQMIFCDMSTPKPNVFNIYDEVKDKLLKAGVPEDEIAYIHNANSDAKKKELFSKVRQGKVRILLGSTAKMGAGTNVQNLLIASHDLDCPWRPSDLEQRAGRIIRQGNTNPEVHIYRYVTEGTFDAYLYQLVENKQKFISQIMTSKTPVRSAEDIDEASLNYAEIKALASGNPRIKEKMDLDMEVSKLKLAKANYLSEKYDLEDKILKYYPQRIQQLKSNIKYMEQDLSSTVSSDTFTGMTIKDIAYTEKEKAGQALLLCCNEIKSTEETFIGNYRGFDMNLQYDSFYKYFKLRLKNNYSYQVELGDDVFGNITRIDNVIESIPKKIDVEKRMLSDTKQQFNTAKEQVTIPFSKENELKDKLERLSILNKELDINSKDADIIADEPNNSNLEKTDLER